MVEGQLLLNIVSPVLVPGILFFFFSKVWKFEVIVRAQSCEWVRQSFGFAACSPSRSAVPSAGLCRRSDLKAVLLTILLHPQDLPHFSFSFLPPNFQETMKRYQ